MKRSALIGAALAASLATVLAIGLGGAGAAPRVSPNVNVQPYVYVSIADASALEGTQNVPMTISSSAKVAFPIEVYWETVDGTATAPRDYLHQWGTAVIPAGKTSTTCLLSSTADGVYEPNRSFTVHISSENHAVRISRPDASFTILDSGHVPTVQIADAPTITEGGDLTYALTLSNPTAATVTVNVDPAGAGTSPTWNADDYTGSAATTVTFAPLQTTASYTFHSIDDAVYEGQEHVWLHMTGATNAVLPPDYVGWADQTDAWANGIVNDNESPPVVAISDAGPLHVTEGQDLTFTLTLSGPSQMPVVVAVDPYGAGTSTDAADYSSPPATAVTFDPLQTSVTYMLHTSVDAVSEGQEHVWLHLTGVTGGFMPAVDWIGWNDPTDAWAIGYVEDGS